LVGPVELLRAADVDLETFTFTLPLYRGEMTDGTPVWYILTDTTDEGNANALGLNHSPKLAYANVEGAVRTATLAQDLTLIFDQGAVDFAPERRISPGVGDEPFPPVVAEPGSVGDAAYSPLVRIENAGGHIYNAPIIAQGVEAEELQGFCEGAPDYGRVHDRVISICPDRALVTLKAVAGFSFARPVVYVSFEASDPMAATMEQSTFAPALANIQVGFDDGAFSAVERLFSFANGPTGVGNPQRQGFASVLSGESTEPLNVFGGVPTIALDYSPLWDMNLGVWTDEAIENGYRRARIPDRPGWRRLRLQRNHHQLPDRDASAIDKADGRTTRRRVSTGSAMREGRTVPFFPPVSAGNRSPAIVRSDGRHTPLVLCPHERLYQ
jgi:hypothetical protein